MAVSKEVKRVCILTGGGDAPGLNAVLRAFVRTALHHDLEVFGAEDGFQGLIEPGRLRKMDRESVRGILPLGGSVLGCSNKANPFHYKTHVEDDGQEMFEDVSGQVIKRLEDNNIDALVLVGGDGTQTMGVRLSERGVNVVGVPKTIDNDIAATDLTFGFDTAVKTATWAIDTLHSTAEAHDRVMIVEVMGRNAGWIALCAGIAGGADAILIPEIPYDVNRVAAKIKRRAARGAHFSIVVVGEGAHPVGGATAIKSHGTQGHLPRLGGIGQQLAGELAEHVKDDIRVTVLGHLQRGGSPTPYDRVLGSRFGVKAAELCAAGKLGQLVCLQGTNITSVPLKIENKLVNPNGEMVRTARLLGVELGAE